MGKYAEKVRKTRAFRTFLLIILDKEMPYKKAIKFNTNNRIKYIIVKSRREGYDVRIITDSFEFKKELVQEKDINISRNLTGIKDLIYVDINGKLCCTKTLESAINLVKYNEKS